MCQYVLLCTYMNSKLTRTTILLDKDLVRLAKMKAASEGLTLSKLVTKLITSHLKNGGVKELIGAIATSRVVIDSAVISKNKGFIKGHP